MHHVVAVGADWFSPHEEFEIRQVIELGTPHSNIVDLAKREGVDMIVMSTHGRSGLEHVVLGSETEKVVARACCPVIVVPATYGEPLANAA